MKTASQPSVQDPPTTPSRRKSGMRRFLAVELHRRSAEESDHRQVFEDLVTRVKDGPRPDLFDAIEAGVPTYMVEVIAGATGEPVSEVMGMIGVSPTTYRRKHEANEPLPDAAGHRVMGYLRVVALLRKLLEESGDLQALKDFDLVSWVARWIREPLTELGNKTPAEMLRNPEGQRAIEQVLERMRGGLPA